MTYDINTIKEMLEHTKVVDKREAMHIASMLLPTLRFFADKHASTNAGYPVHLTNSGGGWVSDLGTRLEVNFNDGKTINIWITEDVNKQEKIKELKKELHKAMFFHANYEIACLSNNYKCFEEMVKLEKRIISLRKQLQKLEG